ncbi:MAG: hypothetical protein H0T46_20605 [Deltaproteobacteria bacterium]|nr:hypothetical protein [Deltaproteobacteria bacterium]
MASNRTEKSKKKPAPVKKAAAPKKAPKEKSTAPKAPRHPKGRVGAAHGSKADLAKALASSIARGGQDAGDVETQLKTASNQQLLRLQKTVETVKAKWGNRDKLIAAIGSAQNKSKDKDYLAKLDSFSLPQLVDIAVAGERRART